MAVDPSGESNPIEEILLTGFPNPDRIGCPLPEVIEALGNRSLGRDHPVWQHVWSCSPCFRDFKSVRDQRLAMLRHSEKAKRNRRTFIGTAVASACAGVGGYLFFSSVRQSSKREFATVSIDLTAAGTVRGGQPDLQQVVAELPRRLDELHLILPRLSQTGRYIIAVLQSRSQNTAIALGSAAATGTEMKATIVVTLDLSDATPGRYFLGTRLEDGAGQSIPNYYPVLIIAG